MFELELEQKITRQKQLGSEMEHAQNNTHFCSANQFRCENIELRL